MDIEDPCIPDSTKPDIQPRNILMEDIPVYTRARIK